MTTPLRRSLLLAAVFIAGVIFSEITTSVRLVGVFSGIGGGDQPSATAMPENDQARKNYATESRQREGLPNNQGHSDMPPLPPSPARSFGACLMVKDDNFVLYEWLAYHYTMLPLRYVVVLNDSGSKQNPIDVLQRWNRTDLTYWIWQQTEPPITAESQQAAHFDLKARQNVFVLNCTRFMKSMNLTWVTHTDPDEYIVLHRINKEDDQFRKEKTQLNATSFHNTNATVGDFVRIRQSIPPFPSKSYTAMDLLHTAQSVVKSPCVTIMRVRVGALENKTCEDSTMKTAKELVKSNNMDYARMTSLRFTQRQLLNDFPINTWGKAMLDVSRFTEEMLQHPKNNVHRPFPICPKPILPSYEALFYANHYSGSYESFAARHDARRNGTKQAFESNSWYDRGSTCEFGAHEWLGRFVKHVGIQRAKYLLGATDSIEQSSQQ